MCVLWDFWCRRVKMLLLDIPQIDKFPFHISGKTCGFCFRRTVTCRSLHSHWLRLPVKKMSSSDTARADMLAAIKKANLMMQAKQSEELRGLRSSGTSTPKEPPNTPVSSSANDGRDGGWEVAADNAGIIPHNAVQMKSLAYVSAKERRSDFFTVWGRKIELFISDPSRMTLPLPAELSPNDRRELHQLADKFNLSHHSEGVGRDRHLVLRKDELHFKAPTMAPSAAALEALKEGQHRSAAAVGALIDPSAMRGAGGGEDRFQKTSKYQLRKRTSPTRVEYDDDLADKAVRRLQRATDQYRDAADVGISTEELRVGVTNVEAILADSASSQQQQHGGGGVQWSRYLEGRAEIAAPAATSAATPHATSAAKKTYSEQCLSCATKVPVDFELEKWDCQGYCAKCQRDTVWRLLDTTPTISLSSGGQSRQRQQQQVAAKVSSVPAVAVIASSSNATTTSHKREREESSAAAAGADERDHAANERHRNRDNNIPQQQPEEIIRDDDEDEASDLDEMSCEDAVGIAQMADMHERDVAWVERFVQLVVRSSLAPLAFRIRFCLDLNDLPQSRNFCPRAGAFQYALIQQRTSLTCSAEDDAKPPCLVSQILDELEGRLGSEEVESRLIVAFETSNSTGAGGRNQCICRVSGTQANTEVLSKLKDSFGTQCVTFGPSLAEVLKSAAPGR